MPIEITLSSPKKGQPEMYKKYAAAEILKLWKERVECFTIQDSFTDPRFVLYYTSDKYEAVIVAAIFVRELQAFFECTHYDEELGILSLYYGACTGNHLSEEEALTITRQLIEDVKKTNDIKTITKDRWGYELLWGGIHEFSLG